MNLLGHVLLFWKVTMPAFNKTPNFQWFTTLKKKFGGGSLCTRGAAGIWAMHIFSSTYFDEISIFGLRKDQTFRIRYTLMNPEQFLILVPYLITFGLRVIVKISTNYIVSKNDISMFIIFISSVLRTVSAFASHLAKASITAVALIGAKKLALMQVLFVRYNSVKFFKL